MSHKVLAHALEVEFNIGKLRAAVAKAGTAHERDVKHQAEAETELERAYAAYGELTAAMQELAASTARSKESLGTALAAKKALKDYQTAERKKTHKALVDP